MNEKDCERCNEEHNNNDTPSGLSLCDDCLTMDDVFSEEEE